MLRSIGTNTSHKYAQLAMTYFAAMLTALIIMHASALYAQADNKTSATQNKFGKSDVAPIQLAGTVVDADGKTVSGATVHFKSTYAEIDTTQSTDEHGQFKTQLRLLANSISNIELSAKSADGTLIGNYHWPEANTESVFGKLTITIQTPRTAKVKVIDANGSPIGNANVAMQLKYPYTSTLQTTDANGIAEISIPQSERIKAVVAWKDGAGLDFRSYELSRSNANVQVKAPEFPLDGVQELKLEGAAPLRVDVTDAQGNPLANAETYVWLLRHGEHEQLNLSYLSEFFKTPTNAQGQVTFDWLPAWQKDTTVVWSSVKGYTSPRGEYEPTSKSGHLMIKLERLIPIRGKVTLPDGAPAAGVSVTASGSGYTMDHFHGSATTDDSGRYEILATPNQIYILWVQDKKWGAAAQSGFAVLPNKDVPDHDFQLAPAIRVFGQLLNQSTKEPIPDKYVMLNQYGVDLNTMGMDILPNPQNSRTYVQPILQNGAVTDARGAYEFFVGPGLYSLFTQSVEAEKLTLGSETDKRVDLYMQVQPTIELAGSIVDGQTYKPVGDVKITAVTKNFRYHRDWDAFTDANGKFKANRPADPTILFAISADKHSGAIAEITAEATSVEMRLDPLGSASGRLMTQDGTAPAANTKLTFGVHVEDKKSGLSSNRFGGSITTDENGQFIMENLVPGWNYRCEFYDPNGYVLNVVTAKVEPSEKKELGELRIPESPKPFVPETLEQRIESAFNVAGIPQERYDKANKLIKMVNQNLVILFGKPTDARVHELMKIRFEDDSFRPYSDDFRIMAIPTDGDRLTSARELAATFNVDLSDGREAFHMLIVNHDGELVASAGIKQLCDEDKLSKAKLLAMLEPYRTQPLDAQLLLDNALKQAAQENKRVLVQETATWCGPCHMLSRLLMANRQWEQDYIWIKMDHRWTGAIDIMKKMRGEAMGGIPWFVILDASGKQLATSNIPDSGENIGFPSEQTGQVHFADMLKATRQRMTDAEIDQLVAAAKTQN